MKLVAHGEGLVIRNVRRTLHLRWDEVEDFRVGKSTMSPNGSVLLVLLRNGDVNMAEVTARNWVFDDSRAKLQRTIEQLRAWIPKQV